MRANVRSTGGSSYSRNLRLHVLPRLGSVVLHEISATALNALYVELLENGKRTGGGLSAKSVRYVHTIVHKLLGDAVDAGLVGINAADRARPPTLGKRQVSELRSWEPNELRRFLEAIRGTRLEALWHLGAFTGMRRGELLGLRWKDVDLDASRLAVRHTIISVAYEIQSSTPKTHQARTVDLDPTTVEVLGAHRGRQLQERCEWASEYDDRDLVFCRENGTPLHPDGVTQTFERLVTRSGLPRIRLHDLRHTHATIALKAGVPVKVISERLGHESPAFTMKQYAHVLPGMQADAARTVAQLVLAPGPSSPTEGPAPRLSSSTCEEAGDVAP